MRRDIGPMGIEVLVKLTRVVLKVAMSVRSRWM